MSDKRTEIATLGGGCYWCVEAVMQRLQGVEKIESGFMGGHVENPSYEAVCGMGTGHVEVIQITFDPQHLSFEELLDVFWQAHDPTTMDQQGGDRGPQYRSAVFYHSDTQQEQTEASIEKLNASHYYPDPVVTVVEPAETFWIAPDYHQDFYTQNKDYGYCRAVIHPKLRKLKMDLSDEPISVSQALG
jgi:peptide-methionine (S)-S-oxide reductase